MTVYTKPMLAAALLLAGSLSLLAQAPAAPAPSREAQLIAVLKSEAGQKEKADACRDLGQVGGRDAVAALAALLNDEKLAHMARYGLEMIPDPAAADALRDALGTLKGLRLVGAIHSVGVKRDAKAVKALAALLSDSDPAAAAAAASALGKIGTEKAADALGKALKSASGVVKTALCDGILLAAEAALKDGRKGDAADLYDLLRKTDAPRPVQLAALRGAILSRGSKGVSLLVEQARGNDAGLAAIAFQTLRENNDPKWTPALVEAMGQLPPERQILMLQALADRGDASAAPAVEKAAATGPADVRVTAIQTLVRLGAVSGLPNLVGWTTDAEASVAGAAKAAVAAFEGPGADAAVLALLNKPDAASRNLGIELAGQRRIAAAIPSLLKSAADADETVRASSLKVLGELATLNDLPALVALLSGAPSPKDMTLTERAITAVCTRQPDPSAGADALVKGFAAAKGPARLSLLRLLRATGGASALATARAAAADADTAVRNAALRVLCEWPSADAMSDVSTLAKSSPDATVKILALRGWLRLIPLQQAAPEAKLAMLKEAMPLAAEKQDKALALSALGGIPSSEALAMAAGFLDNADLKQEAATAAVNIAEKIVTAQPAAVAEAMKKVIAGNADEQLVRRARQLNRQANPKN